MDEKQQPTNLEVQWIPSKINKNNLTSEHLVVKTKNIKVKEILKEAEKKNQPNKQTKYLQRNPNKLNAYLPKERNLEEAMTAK